MAEAPHIRKRIEQKKTVSTEVSETPEGGTLTTVRVATETVTIRAPANAALAAIKEAAGQAEESCKKLEDVKPEKKEHSHANPV